MAEPIPLRDALLDIRRLLATLAAHHVDYVVVGGVAAVLRGSPLATTRCRLMPAG